MSFRPIANHFLCKPYKRLKSQAGLYLPETTESKSLMEVVAKGDGNMADGKIEPMYAEIGDIILLADEKAVKEVPGEEGLFIISNHNIVAIKDKDE